MQERTSLPVGARHPQGVPLPDVLQSVVSQIMEVGSRVQPFSVESVEKTRDETFVERLPDGREVNHTLGIASLGGATLDVEENYLMKKLFSGGLGIVSIENQARI